MKRTRLRIFLITITGLILLIAYQLATLIVDETPVVSDIIIIPEGSSDGERALKAKELLNHGYSTSGLVMPSPIYLEDSIDQVIDPTVKADGIAMREMYYRFGFNEYQILSEIQATSTYTNAVNTLALMDQHGYQSAIIVSSDYHMRRVEFIYDKVNRDSEYKFDLTYVAAYHPKDGDLHPWYDIESLDIRTGLSEVFKMWGYLLRLYHVIDL